MRRPMRVAALLLVLGAPGVAAQQLLPGEQVLVRDWLECIECVSGQLDSVRALALAKPAASIAVLSEALQRGPPDSVRTALDLRLRHAYDRDTASARRAGLPVSTVALGRFAERYVARYVFWYRVRAALALDSIGTPQATGVLNAVLRDSIPDSLRQRVVEALGSPRTP